LINSEMSRWATAKTSKENFVPFLTITLSLFYFYYDESDSVEHH
jgi:hypothetical protein